VKLLEVFGGLANVFFLCCTGNGFYWHLVYNSPCVKVQILEFEELLNGRFDVELAILSSGNW
jgi:hypothetical protein